MEEQQPNTTPPPNIPFIVTSRFNEGTYAENLKYRTSTDMQGCIYGSPLQLSSKIKPLDVVYVVEMNNDTNEIIGVGVIRNIPLYQNAPNVYRNGNYNRYIYKGRFRIPRSILLRNHERIVQVLEKLLFTGKTHMKRGSGLTMMPPRLLSDPRCPKDMNLPLELQQVFNDYFLCPGDTELKPDDVTERSLEGRVDVC